MYHRVGSVDVADQLGARCREYICRGTLYNGACLRIELPGRTSGCRVPSCVSM
jgi:hypothetical protein